MAEAYRPIGEGSLPSTVMREVGRAEDSPDRDAVDDAAERAEAALQQPVQATVRSRAQWESASDSFITQVRTNPVVVVLADESLDLHGPGAARPAG